MSKRVLVKVTRAHIIGARYPHGGRVSLSQGCPIAIAVRLATNAEFVSVGDGGITVKRKMYRCPRSAQRFIHRWDALLSVLPFSFYLTAAR